MDLNKVLEYVAKVIGLPIRVYNNFGDLLQVYGDFNTFPFSYDQDLLLLEQYEKDRKEILIPVKLYKNQKYSNVAIEDLNEKKVYIFGSILGMTGNIKDKIDVKDWDLLLDSIILVYEGISGTALTKHELLMHAQIDPQNILEHEKKVLETFFHYHENQVLHNPYAQELREQGSIREGNLERLKMSFQESYSGKLAVLSKNHLRSVKNLGIVVLAISTRAAIEGGLHPEQAFLLSDSYILNVDEAKSEEEIYHIVRGAEINFTQLVAENKTSKTENPIVMRAKNVIYKKIHDKISLSMIAKELNTTPSYLSTIFKKETSLTVRQFIVQEKLFVAADLLCYSQYTIDEIANYLAFASQSHFGHLFKQKYGITPNQYRLKYAQKEV
ncbi:AraC family transcriptional regulator [Enterococcus sp.]|uniref:helix-turn-helix domain-containing protein n=1 Tax=Enterococcus sp. TaxID=35783 RepID=UPI00289D469C|nr:AraC family transcriptional regulator [Enterococcus sp.]